MTWRSVVRTDVGTASPVPSEHTPGGAALTFP
jgi:hypothetical protein